MLNYSLQFKCPITGLICNKQFVLWNHGIVTFWIGDMNSSLVRYYFFFSWAGSNLHFFQSSEVKEVKYALIFIALLPITSSIAVLTKPVIGAQ